MTVMVDWITCKLPLRHDGTISGGRVLKIDQEGNIEWDSRQWLAVEGSHDASIQVKTVEVDEYGNGTWISFSGNPVKWFQGHNVFGTDQVHELIMVSILRICHLLEVIPTQEEINAWWDGDYTVSRVDVNRMYNLQSLQNVHHWIYHCSRNARSRHGAGIIKQGTLYFGKGSRRWQCRCYAKGSEITAKGRKLHPAFIEAGLVEYALPMLRIEVVLQQLELAKLSLATGKMWATGVDLLSLHAAYVEKIDMSDQKLNIIEDKLPTKLRTAYLLWESGKNVREYVSKNTFCKYRRELLKHGVDISVQKPVEEPSNVVPFVRVVKMVPAEVPDWARNSDLFFEPRKLLGM